jgi:hypothetical protein
MTISVPRNAHRSTSNPDVSGAPAPALDLEAPDGPYSPDGERVTMSEKLVVSPVWGRLQKHSLTEGQWLEEGSVIGSIHEAGSEFPLVCHGASMFVTWLAYENERVPPGRALARLRSIEE